MKKRGSHVGIVLSFVIFVVFLIFLYSIIEPTMRTQRDKESLLDYLEIELIQNFSAEMITMTIMNKTEISSSKDCIKLKNMQDDIIGAGAEPDKLIIKDKLNNIRDYLNETNDLLIENPSHVGFFKIYYSEALEGSPMFSGGGCQLLKEEDDYTLGLTRTETYIFEKKVIELMDEYGSEGGYESIKDKLNIPLGSEFGFSLMYNNKTIIGTEEKDISTSIYVREVLMQYVDSEAIIRSGSINIQVW